MIALLIKRRFLSLAAAVVLIIAGSGTVSAQSEAPEVSAQAAVVYCADNETVLFAKNAEARHSMASTTKIMTALLTLEAAAVENKPVTITAEMAQVEGSSMGLQAGDVIRLRELAVGMLTVSGNDAANAAAIAVGGSVEQFAVRMNRRAAELGMTNTSFVTPSGLDDDNHYTTALDMAKLGAAAIQNEAFLAICRAPSMRASFEVPQKTVTLTNHNKLLKLYDGCIGIKTGFTKKSGRCLVSAAERNGITLIAVTLSAPDDWNDHMAMLDYGFSQLEQVVPEAKTFTVPVVGGTVSELTAAIGKTEPLLLTKGQTVTETINLPPFVYAPVKAGDTLGSITYAVNGEGKRTVPLQSAMDVPAEPIQESVLQKIGRWIAAIFS